MRTNITENQKPMFERMSERNYVFRQESNLEHYEAEPFVVACVDDRFSKVRADFLESLEIEHIDPKTPAGGAKVFSSPFESTDRDHYLRELEISIKHHKVKKVMLFTHHDCAAYGGFGKFENDEDKELSFHAEEHKKAASVIKERFPDIEIEAYFQDGHGIVRTL